MLAVRSTKMSIVKSENPLEPPANSLGSRRLHKGRIGWHAGTKPKFNEEFHYLRFSFQKKEHQRIPKKGRVEDSGSGSVDSFGVFLQSSRTDAPIEIRFAFMSVSTPEFTNMTIGKSPIFNRKYIFIHGGCSIATGLFGGRGGGYMTPFTGRINEKSMD